MTLRIGRAGMVCFPPLRSQWGSFFVHPGPAPWLTGFGDPWGLLPTIAISLWYRYHQSLPIVIHSISKDFLNEVLKICKSISRIWVICKKILPDRLLHIILGHADDPDNLQICKKSCLNNLRQSEGIWLCKKNKTIEDGGFTVDFWIRGCPYIT